MKSFIWTCLVWGLALGLWQAVAAAGWVSPLLLPSPWETVRYLAGAAADGFLAGALWVTLRRLLIGFIIGVIGGLALGFLIHASLVARRTLGLAALGLQTLPSVCWAPLAILWFGQSEAAMYFVVIMGTIWGLTLAVKNALESTPPTYIRAAGVMGASRLSVWTGVILPSALPMVLSGAKLGWAFAWRSLMAAEIYVTIIEQFGLGQLLHFGRELNAMDQVLGVMLVIVLVGALTDHYVFRPAEKYFQRTRGLSGA